MPHRPEEANPLRDRPPKAVERLMSKDTNPLIAGFLGGVVSTTFLLPLDVIKVRLVVCNWRSRDAKNSITVMDGHAVFAAGTALYLD
jgi:hypothetical protein